MDTILEPQSKVCVRDPMETETENGGKSNMYSGEGNKCNQCEYSSAHTGSLGRHLKMHSGDKSNNCNQCDYAMHPDWRTVFVKSERVR